MRVACCDVFDDPAVEPRESFFCRMEENVPAEFMSCGAACTLKIRALLAAHGKCAMECGAPWNAAYTIGMLVRDDECSEQTGCAVDCRLHIAGVKTWLVCSDVCRKKFGTKVGQHPQTVCIVQCANCAKEHVNPEQELLVCKTCDIKKYCNEQCREQHWTKGHQHCCEMNKN